MLKRPITLLLLGISLYGCVSYAQSESRQLPSSTPAPADKPKQTATETTPPQAPDKSSAQSPAPAPGPAAAQDQAKPEAAAKPHHIITNEDIQAQHDLIASANSDVNIGNINDCDRTCFEMVRSQTGYWLTQNTDWKRDLLRGIEQVSDDPKWQAALFHIARVKSKFCDLAQDKNDALADVADPRKMTEDEIAIDEQYDRKFKTAQAELNSALADADAIMRSYGGIVVTFMRLQKQRACNRVCIIRYPVRYRPYNPPRDDPDDP